MNLENVEAKEIAQVYFELVGDAFCGPTLDCGSGPLSRCVLGTNRLDALHVMGAMK